METWNRLIAVGGEEGGRVMVKERGRDYSKNMFE